MSAQSWNERREEFNYQEALNRVAKEVGLRPDELEKKIEEASEGLKLTAQCLTLGELEIHPKLSKARIEHIAGCDFCERLLQAAEPGTDEVERFLDKVADSSQSKSALTLAELEREYILKVLRDSAWDKRQAAETLGIKRLTLWRKIRQHHRTA